MERARGGARSLSDLLNRIRAFFIRIVAGLRREILVSPHTRYRSPSDVIYMVTGAVVLFITSLIALAARGYFRAADVSLFRLIDALPDSIFAALNVIMQAGQSGAVPVAVVLALLLRRLGLARNLALAGSLAWLLNKVVKIIVEQGRPAAVLDLVHIRGTPATGLGFPSGHSTIIAAMAMVAGPYINQRWRWTLWVLVGLVALARVYVGAHFPMDVVGGLALGILIGSFVNLIFGIPQQDISTQVIREVFEKRDIILGRIAPVRADARGSVPYFARTPEGDEYFIKLVGTENRNADFLFKIWRSMLLKNVATNVPYLTPKQQIDHEAYLTLLAREHDVRTPPVEFTTKVKQGYSLLAQKRIKGRTLDEFNPDEIDNRLLKDIWRQVKNLHEARIAHGDLRLSNILVDEKNKPWIIDFGFSESGVEDPVLAQDTAQMLASLTPAVGEERTVAAAIDALGEEAVYEAAPALRPLALSSATRQDLKTEPKMLDDIRETIAQETGEELPKGESVFRLEPKHLLWVLGLGIGVYTLLPQIGQLGKILEIWGTANLLWVGVGLVVSALTYVAAAISQRGAIEKSLDLVRGVIAQFAATFASRLGPQGLGGAYVIERYIEKAGVERRQAVTAVTLNAAAGAAVHIILVLIVLTVLGVGGGAFMGQVKTWQAIAIIVALAIVAIFLLRSPRRFRKMVESIRASLRDLVNVLRQPNRALQLFGGALGITTFYTAALLFSLWAVGANVSVLQAAGVFLAGSIIGSASPTPGGLGVLESAFVAGLVSFGVSSEQAVAGVLLYRLLTFWLPILPGVFAFRYLQKQGCL